MLIWLWIINCRCYKWFFFHLDIWHQRQSARERDEEDRIAIDDGRGPSEVVDCAVTLQLWFLHLHFRCHRRRVLLPTPHWWQGRCSSPEFRSLALTTNPQFERIHGETFDEDLEAMACSGSSDNDEVAEDNPLDSDEDPVAAEDGEDDEQVRIIFYSFVVSLLLCSMVYTLLLILSSMFCYRDCDTNSKYNFVYLHWKSVKIIGSEFCSQQYTVFVAHHDLSLFQYQRLNAQSLLAHLNQIKT